MMGRCSRDMLCPVCARTIFIAEAAGVRFECVVIPTVGVPDHGQWTALVPYDYPTSRGYQVVRAWSKLAAAQEALKMMDQP